jgi:hypothetical protein
MVIAFPINVAAIKASHRVEVFSILLIKVTATMYAPRATQGIQGMTADPGSSSCCANRPCIAAKELPFMKIVNPKSMASAIIIIDRIEFISIPPRCDIRWGRYAE